MSHAGMRRSGFAAVVVASIGFGMVPSASAAAVACGQTITTSIVLTADLGPCPGDGLIVTAGGITVDLGGHTIRGDGSPTTTPDQVGIRLRGVSNVRVANGTVRDFNGGVSAEGGGANTFTALTITRNIGSASSPHGDGISFFGSNDNRLSRLTVSSNGPFYGVDFNNSSRNNLSDSFVTDNNIVTPAFGGSPAVQFDIGIGFDGSAADDVVQRNTIERNGYAGTGAGTRPTRRQIINNVVRDNGVLGLDVGGIGGDLVSGNVVEHNGYDQFRVGTTPSDFGLVGGIVMCGACFEPGPADTFTSNSVNSNKGVGIGLYFNYFQCCNQPARDFVRSHLVQNNVVRGNTGDGIYVECDQTFTPFPFVPGVSHLECINAPPHPGQRIFFNHTGGNGGANAGISAWDLHDGNPDCDDDVWRGNTYVTANPPCTRG